MLSINLLDSDPFQIFFLTFGLLINYFEDFDNLSYLDQ